MSTKPSKTETVKSTVKKAVKRVSKFFNIDAEANKHYPNVDCYSSTYVPIAYLPDRASRSVNFTRRSEKTTFYPTTA